MAIPAGVIVAWPSTNASIPSGWSRETTLDGRYTRQIATSSTAPGTTGGGATHQHSTPAHTHSTASHTHTCAFNCAQSGDQSNCPVPSKAHIVGFNNSGCASDNLHQHVATAPSGAAGTVSSGGATCVAAANTDPPFFTVIFIKSDGTPSGVPNAAIVHFNNATIPTNWRLCDGATGAPDLRNAFMRGAATSGDGGAVGGALASHSHTAPTHTHPSSGAHQHNTNSSTGFYTSGCTRVYCVVSHGLDSPVNFNAAPTNHTHAGVTTSDAPAGATGTGSAAACLACGQPTWKKIIPIQNNSGGNSSPVGIIAMWTGAIASIPGGWRICDGLSGTPNLSNGSYVKSTSTTTELGNTGGASTHTHASTGHSHTVASHTHTTHQPIGSTPYGLLGSGSTLVGSGCSCGTSGRDVDQPHQHSWNITRTSGASTETVAGATLTTGANTSNDPLYTTVAYIQLVANQYTQTVAGALSFSGAITRRDSRLHTGGLSFSGSITKGMSRALTATASFSGAILKSFSRALTGAASFSGAMTATHISFKALTAGLSFSGALVAAGKKAVTGALSFSGAILRYTPRVVAGTLSFSGAMTRKLGRSVAGTLSFAGTLLGRGGKALSGALSFSGSALRAMTRPLSATVSFSGSVLRVGARAISGAVSFAGGVTTKLTHYLFFASSVSFSGLLKVFKQWIQVQLAILEKPILEISKPQWQANIQVKGPIEMAYKRGTNVLFEATFTDKDGNSYDPDVGTAKLYAKRPDGTYITGYDPAVGGRLMNQISTGVYQADVQFQRTDQIGQWEIEVEGYVGTKRSLDSLKIQVRA